MHHGAGLRALLEQAGRPAAEIGATIEALSGDWRAAPIDAPDRAMLEYAHALTVRPSGVGTPDLERLRSAGLDDRAIHDLCAIVAYFAFANRVADGLAVQLEPRFNR